MLTEAQAMTYVIYPLLGVLALWLVLFVVFLFGWKFSKGWRTLRNSRNSIAYRGRKYDTSGEAFRSPIGYSTFEANRKAARLLMRTCGLTVEQTQAIVNGTERLVVIGGATGKRYELFARFMLPISIPAEHTYLCGGPFNSHAIPRTDNMIAQALYLSCPTTERDFVALCNKTDFAQPQPFIHL